MYEELQDTTDHDNVFWMENCRANRLARLIMALRLLKP